MVKDGSDSKITNDDDNYDNNNNTAVTDVWAVLTIGSKGSFICTIPQTRQYIPRRTTSIGTPAILLMVDSLSYSRSNQCSTTGVTKAVVCAILFVGWCIYKKNLAINQNRPRWRSGYVIG